MTGREPEAKNIPLRALSRYQAAARNQGNSFDAKVLQYALARLEVTKRKWAEIVPSEKVRDIAENLPDAYGLRALDSCQLAAGLVWCNEKPNGRLLVCDDAKLSTAAQKNGFSIKP